MKRQGHSTEFAGRHPEKSSQTYGKGDRVRILASGALATVTYAIHTDRGHFVTVRIDGRQGVARPDSPRSSAWIGSRRERSPKSRRYFKVLRRRLMEEEQRKEPYVRSFWTYADKNNRIVIVPNSLQAEPVDSVEKSQPEDKESQECEDRRLRLLTWCVAGMVAALVSIGTGMWWNILHFTWRR